jgi:hypothetical protein
MPQSALANSIAPEPSGSVSMNAPQQLGGSPAAGPADVTPEIMAVIETAASAFTGKKVRVISVKVVSEPPARAGSWVGHGLNLVHGSHNEVQRGR